MSEELEEISAELPEEQGFQLQSQDTDWGSFRVTRKSEVSYGLVNISESYFARRNDRYIIANGSSALTVTLPKSNIGKVYTIKNLTAGVVTITGGDFKIDGSNTDTLNALYTAMTLVFNGSDWSIVMEI